MQRSFSNYDERTIHCAEYIYETGQTVREAAKRFGLSKSTVHKDITTRLAYIDHALYEKVRVILDRNKAERHMRGGLATKHKYEELKEIRGNTNPSKRAEKHSKKAERNKGL